MRMFMRVMFDVEAANRAIKDGSIGTIIEGFARAFNPEGIWFVAQEGKRCMVAVFDLPSVSKIPAAVEPMFAGLGASIDITPAMDLADLQSGLGSL
ncbi:MAG: hypothetical protein ABL956_14635 [Hyphomonadaceae bacterium]